MSDSSKLSADEYLAKCNAMSTNAYKGMVGKMEAEAYSSGQFKPGQTVWCKFNPKIERKVLFSSETYLWLESCDGSAPTTVLKNDFTATDPNAKSAPEPKACPKCGGPAKIYPGLHYVRCSNVWCIQGPRMETVEEAIAAWNSIEVKGEHPGVERYPDLNPPWRDDANTYFKCDAFGVPLKETDDAPLTEEWLRKVGLWDGLAARLGGSKFRIRAGEDVMGGPYLRLTSGARGGIDYPLGKNVVVGDARQLCRLLGVNLKE